MFGMPLPSSEKWVAIAMLNEQNIEKKQRCRNGYTKNVECYVNKKCSVCFLKRKQRCYRSKPI